MNRKLFDVVAVNLDTLKIRLIAENKTEKNADAIEMMAVMRNGVDEEFFSAVSSGQYKDGDTWEAK